MTLHDKESVWMITINSKSSWRKDGTLEKEGENVKEGIQLLNYYVLRIKSSRQKGMKKWMKNAVGERKLDRVGEKRGAEMEITATRGRHHPCQ